MANRSCWLSHITAWLPQQRRSMRTIRKTLADPDGEGTVTVKIRCVCLPFFATTFIFHQSTLVIYCLNFNYRKTYWFTSVILFLNPVPVGDSPSFIGAAAASTMGANTSISPLTPPPPPPNAGTDQGAPTLHVFISHGNIPSGQRSIRQLRV